MGWARPRPADLNFGREREFGLPAEIRNEEAEKKSGRMGLPAAPPQPEQHGSRAARIRKPTGTQIRVWDFRPLPLWLLFLGRSVRKNAEIHSLED